MIYSYQMWYEASLNAEKTHSVSWQDGENKAVHPFLNLKCPRGRIIV